MSRKEKENIRNMFRGYRRVTGSMVKALEKYGLTVSCDGKHYKVQREDRIGGCVILAKTPSDFKTGLNISGYLIKLIEA